MMGNVYNMKYLFISTYIALYFAAKTVIPFQPHGHRVNGARYGENDPLPNRSKGRKTDFARGTGAINSVIGSEVRGCPP